MPAEDLKVGTKVLLSDGSYGIIESVRAIHYDIPQTTYNFEVSDFHTYYVGNGVLVHNMNGGDCGLKNKKELSPLNKEEIKYLGGESATSRLKAEYGGSKANLYTNQRANIEIGNRNLYVANNHSNYAEYLGKLSENTWKKG